ncbi:MAG: hypothetical protein VB027_03275 [Gordonibacter sp.]|nr:hypothetical protein [Gordonibacter sp.]
MGESIRTYEKVLNYPLETVWEALHRTVDLDLQGGMAIHTRISDSEWTTKLQNRVTHCSTAFDETTHTATVTMKVDIRRNSDTVALTAVPTQNGTRVGIAFYLHANFILIKLSELLGSGAYEAIANSVFKNIIAICENRSTCSMSQDELEAYAHNLVDGWKATEEKTEKHTASKHHA